MMLHTSGFIFGEFDHFFRAWGKTHFSKDNAVSMTNNIFNSFPNLVRIYVEITQYFGGNPATFVYKGKQEMFCATIVVLKELRFFLGATENPFELHCKRVKSIVVYLYLTLGEVCLGKSRQTAQGRLKIGNAVTQLYLTIAKLSGP